MEFIKLHTNREITGNTVEVSGDTLTVTVVDSTLFETQGHITRTESFSISDLITNYSQDHGCLAFYPADLFPNGSSNLLVIETTQLSLPEKAKPGEEYTSFVTTPGKQYSGSPFSVINTRFNSYAFLYILTPYADCSSSDLIVVCRDSTSLTVTVDGTTPNFTTSIMSLKGFLDTWMPITITGPTHVNAGSSVSYTVYASSNATVYLSTDIGMINRSKITNNKTFLLNTDGLTAGETITIKTGYKYWSGVSTFTVTLV